MSKTIMVVDDEKRLVSLVESYLAQEGYRVVIAHDGAEALTVARREKPDLIVLDVMMPEMDGYEFMRKHRADHNTPIILLTARVGDEEKVIGLEIGADDYMTKPFRPRELVARVRAVLRRAGDSQPSAKVLKAADIILDRDGRTVRVAEQFVDLTPSEFDILTALMTSPGRVYSRLDLLDIIQGVRYEGYERTIDTHIKNLRGKIETDPREPYYIETVYGSATASKGLDIHALHLLETDPGFPQYWHCQRCDYRCHRHLEHKSGVHPIPIRSDADRHRHPAFRPPPHLRLMGKG